MAKPRVTVATRKDVPVIERPAVVEFSTSQLEFCCGVEVLGEFHTTDFDPNSDLLHDVTNSDLVDQLLIATTARDPRKNRKNSLFNKEQAYAASILADRGFTAVTTSKNKRTGNHITLWVRPGIAV